jgi:DNA-nicking Smr family endonuclease
MKDLAALKAFQQRLKEKAEDERQRREHEAQLAREANLFRNSMGNVKPLTVPPRVHADAPKPLPVARQRIADDAAVLEESLSDEFSIETLLETDDTLSYARAGIGPDVMKKLRGGGWVTQDQLDLHGLRVDQAREAVAAFVRESMKRGFRCVRIIHGKGLGSLNKQPVLKSKVRNWLVQKEEVIAFCQARAADGGSGALMVLLKG